MPKEPYMHIPPQVYSQKFLHVWCILQILHSFQADVAEL